jgi:hypothetical protein
MADYFDVFTPVDGYHVITLSTPEANTLHLVTLSGGEPIVPFDSLSALTSAALLRMERPNDYAKGAAQRLQRVLNAVCTYFNTGGDRMTLEMVLQRMFCQTEGLSIEGYSYIACLEGEEGWPTHLFVKTTPTGVVSDDTPAVLYEEPELIGGGSSGSIITEAVIGGCIRRVAYGEVFTFGEGDDGEEDDEEDEDALD